ncbi:MULTISPECIES: V-type ATP synthase subunit E [unclassified Blastococcus]|uniref:V-type ATP synthase subunit E n=1 Tax=unclassified Blastococcus TaxID=2619396 RepID=UPI001F270F80|nr:MULTISPECIES: V-type ATP synthase subunit E [unclassified Blastococcus]MCF6735546.1 hypothetical protein [Blastococcus sp. KM273129]UOX99945.1 V-type ATP synthase subunit E [Blastococcus sp. PRF04-17]
MSLTDLLRSLDGDAAAELDRVRRAAEDEARRITGEARADADAVRAAALADAQARGTRTANRVLAEARAEAAAHLRTAREQALHQVLERTQDRLAVVRESPGYGGLLTRCLTEALDALAAPVTVRVDPRDGDLARELAARQRGGLEVRPDLETWGGCMVTDAGGRFIDNTLEARLQAAWPGQRAAIAAHWSRPATADGGPPTRGRR